MSEPWTYGRPAVGGVVLSILLFFAIHLGDGGALLDSWVKGASGLQWLGYIAVHLLVGPAFVAVIVFIRNQLVARRG